MRRTRLFAARAVLAGLLAVTALAGLAGAAAAHPVTLPATTLSAASTLAGDGAEEPGARAMGLPLLTGGTTPSAGSRPAVVAEPAGAADRVTPPAALVRGGMAVASMDINGRPAALVVPREKLPFAFHVERAVANRFGLDVAVGSMRQWDGIPGSRWATAHAGVVEQRVSKAAVDGRSVLFAMDSCPHGVGGYAYWQLQGAVADDRYGTAAVYVDEVDIGVCPIVRDARQLRFVVEHEVGHALGLQHVCDPGQDCWQQGMGGGSHACRVMYGGASTCRRMDTPEFDSAVHLYPRLRRVAGPSRVETAARFSFASFGKGQAGVVVLARADGAAHGPLAAAALSAGLGAGFLIGAPDAERCVGGSAAQELARVSAADATVLLVGDWPALCERALGGWGLQVERLGGATPDALAVAVADRLAASGRMGASAFLVSDRVDGSGSVPDGVAAGAAAGVKRGPVLYSAPDRLSPATAAWLRANPAVRRVYLLGGPAALSDGVVGALRAQGVEVVRVSGQTRVHTALALASRGELFAAGKPVVLAAAGSWADAVTGSALGGRTGAPVLLTGPAGDAPVAQWLSARRPAGGFVVGGVKALPYELQWRFSRLVG